MIVPSIDLMNGNAVQLVGGKEKALDAGDPRPILDSFKVAGETAVIDLDAALGKGSNETVIRELILRGPCRVGGGIRDAQTALSWLDHGAEKVIIGTRAVPELLSQVPKHRVIAALDAYDGEVVVDGWQTKTGRNVLERMQELRDYVAGFLVTFVEREGRLGGTNIELVEELVAAAGNARVTIAGGVSTSEDIARLDSLGADAQVGMALYTNRMHLGDAISAPLHSEREDGLFPTMVCDERGVALGLCWSSRESIRKAVETKKGVYHSRRRGLWVKGESSGAVQELKAIHLDCDRDALRFTVRQHGTGFCHRDTYTCFAEARGLTALQNTLAIRKTNAPEGSYSKRLLVDPDLLSAKLLEETNELLSARTHAEIAAEAADVLYFTMVLLARENIPLAEVEEVLDQRAKRVRRRPGDAKLVSERD